MNVGGRKPGIPERATTKVELDPGIVTPLRREAARRDVSLQTLVTNLLDAIVEDQLTTAILDDEQSGTPRSERSAGSGDR
jgi:hypothetical protein